MTAAARSAAVIVLASQAACSGEATAPPPIVPARLEVAPASPSRDSIGAEVPVRVLTLDEQGRPLRGVRIAWHAGEGGSVAPATSVSAVDGIATATWRFPNTLGVTELLASAPGGVSLTVTKRVERGAAHLVTLSTSAIDLGSVGDVATGTVVVHDRAGNRVFDLPGVAFDGPAVADFSFMPGDPADSFLMTARAAGTATARIFVGNAVAGLRISVLGLANLITESGRTCGTVPDGMVFCWGDNWNGALGVGSTAASVAAATQLSTEQRFSSVAIGVYAGCGLTAAGAAWCWGQNFEGEVGDGSVDHVRRSPVSVVGGITFAQISAGYGTACGVTGEGVAYCWGSDGNGMLGRQEPVASCANAALYPSQCSNVPLAVDGGLQFKAISVGLRSHVCALTVDGSAYCWGNGSLGQVGSADPLAGCAFSSACTEVPVAVQGGGVYTSVVAGSYMSCALDAAGAAWCWGYLEGQATYMPTRVDTGAAFVSLDAGDYLMCGLTTAGTVLCWNAPGWNGVRHVATDRTFRSISVGGRRLCGTTTAGGSVCLALPDI